MAQFTRTVRKSGSSMGITLPPELKLKEGAVHQFAINLDPIKKKEKDGGMSGRDTD